MKNLFKRLAQALLVLRLILAALALWKREEVTRLLAVNTLFDDARIVENFSHMDRMFLTRSLPRGVGPASALPPGPAATLTPQAQAWIKDRAITGLVILKGGQLVHEIYYLGTGPDDRRISWSMAKSVLSCLFGVVMAEGKITSLDDQVVKYVPALKGSAYDGATLCVKRSVHPDAIAILAGGGTGGGVRLGYGHDPAEVAESQRQRAERRPASFPLLSDPEPMAALWTVTMHGALMSLADDSTLLVGHAGLIADRAGTIAAVAKHLGVATNPAALRNFAEWHVRPELYRARVGRGVRGIWPREAAVTAAMPEARPWLARLGLAV